MGRKCAQATASDGIRRARRAVDASFDCLPNDCKVNIFSYLPLPDLNTIALCSKDCCEARNNESLDQKRTGTIVLTQNTTPESLDNVVAAAEQKNIFSGNCTCLKIEGVERVSWEGDEITLSLLNGVTKLEISQSASEADLVTQDECLAALIEMCPSASDIDLSGVRISDPFELFYRHRSWLESIQRLAWNGCTFLYSFTCLCFQPAANMTELYLDGAMFISGLSSVHTARMYGSMQLLDGAQFYLLRDCRSVQRVSIKGATVRYENDNEEDALAHEDNEEFLPQEFIVKFVRLHPSLRWLRSDLSEENVAMLKAERPEVTFVAE